MTTEPNLPQDPDIPLDPAMPDDPYKVYTPQHRTLIRRWFDWMLPRKGWVFALAMVWGVAGIRQLRDSEAGSLP